MSEEITVGTPVAGENVQPVGTDAEVTESSQEQPVEKSETSAKAPKVETRDGKVYIDNTRHYDRDHVNAMMANAKREAETKLLNDLEVDSFDQVKKVVTELRSAGEDNNLNVSALRDAVKKKEQTVEELRAELTKVKTDYALKEHIGTLKDSMPANWNADQKSAVVDLMRARDMLHIQDDQFFIKNGEDFLLDESGERPNYSEAVTLVGKSLGLPFAKKGVDTFDVDAKPSQTNKATVVDQNKLKSDSSYRDAYVHIRNNNRNLSRDQITDQMVRKQIEKRTASFK